MSVRFLGSWSEGNVVARRIVKLALMLVVACASASMVAAEEPVTLRLWDYHVHDKKFRKNIFNEFNAANPDIKVAYTSQVSGTYEATLNAAFNTGDSPDIFVPAGAASLPKLAELGWIMPLDDVASSKQELDAWKAGFPQGQLPFMEGMNVVNGKTYSWPAGGETGYMLLFWNRTVFRDAGLKGSDSEPLVPETWGDMRQFARKITELGQGKIYGIVHGIKNPAIWTQDLFHSLAIYNGHPNDGFDFKTGRYDFKRPGFRGSIQLWLDMKQDGSIFPGDLSMDDEQAKYRFSQDLAGMIFGGKWVPGGLLAVNPSVDFDVTLPPTEKRGAPLSWMAVEPIAALSDYVVSSKTKRKGDAWRKAVWRVIQFMTSAQYQEEWVKTGGGVSAFPQYNKPEFFPHPTIVKIAQFGITGRKITPQWPAPGPAMYGFDPGQPNGLEIMQGMWVGKLGWDAWDDLERRSNIAVDVALAELRKKGYALTRDDFTFPDWDPTKDYVPIKPKK